MQNNQMQLMQMLNMQGNNRQNGFTPKQLMQMFTQFSNGQNGLNVNNAEQTGRDILQRVNLNQGQLNMIQSAANMIYGMAQKFGILK